MSRGMLLRKFEIWLDDSPMTPEEKADCFHKAQQGFAQMADLLLLGVPGPAEREMLRAMGLGPIRRGRVRQLQNWRLWPCPAKGRQRGCLERFLETASEPERKKLVILLAPAGRGSRIRARRLWKKNARLIGEPELLAVQTRRVRTGRKTDGTLPAGGYDRAEAGEAMLQQTAVDCLQRQMPALTVRQGRWRGFGREQLWYQLAKSL